MIQNKNSGMSRRTFFASLASLTGLLVVSSWSRAWADRARGSGAPAAGGAGDVKMIDPTSPQAKAVNYIENKANIKDATLKADRQGVKFDQQKCQNCGFYSAPKQVGGKEVGACQIFAGQNVKADAWCASWNKKA